MEYNFTPRYPGYLTQAEAAYASGVGDPYQFSIILRQYRGPIEWTKAESLFPEQAKGLYDEIVSEADFATLNQWVQDTGLPMELEHKRKADAAMARVHAEYGYKLGEARRHHRTIPEPQTEADYNLYRQAFPLPEGGEYTAEWEAKLDVKRGAKKRTASTCRTRGRWSRLANREWMELSATSRNWRSSRSRRSTSTWRGICSRPAENYLMPPVASWRS